LKVECELRVLEAGRFETRALAKEVLYHLNHIPSPLGPFSDIVLEIVPSETDN
jgi:hypothetical protein